MSSSQSGSNVPWQADWEQSLMANYATPPIMLVRGQGSRVWDETGKEYIDLIAGIAVNTLGHADPRLTTALNEQMSTLGHVSNLYAHPGAIDVAERLGRILEWKDAKTFFCNSGAEANEAALKISRLTGRTHTVVADGGFHGRTMGALSWTAQPAKQDPFRPLPGDVTVVPFGDSDALSLSVTGETAAIVLEPIQGEGGVRVAPPGYLRAAREIADQHGALLMLDEVQTGIGRTGNWCAFQHDLTDSSCQPDVIMLAKGLGAGIPIGAVVARGRAAELFSPGMHGSTFGGNPMSTRAAQVVLDVVETDGLMKRAQELFNRFALELPDRTGGLVVSVRGRGLLLAAELRDVSSQAFNVELTQAGVLANAVTPTAIRMAPALTISDADIDQALAGWQMASERIIAGTP
jgi:acetylornithine/N-succinyldiaminopimelate aminotransferase